jgi:hypothetical protein
VKNEPVLKRHRLFFLISYLYQALQDEPHRFGEYPFIILANNWHVCFFHGQVLFFSEFHHWIDAYAERDEGKQVLKFRIALDLRNLRRVKFVSVII